MSIIFGGLLGGILGFVLMRYTVLKNTFDNIKRTKILNEELESKNNKLRNELMGV